MIRFIKMHGLGNDFIFVPKNDINNLTNFHIDNFVIKYSDRHIGIGCDQFIFYGEIEVDDRGYQYAEMDIYNSDGSKSGACGNGTRCLAYLLTQNTIEKKIIINVSGRSLLCDSKSRDKVSVNMGRVSFDESWMPKSSTLLEKLSPYLHSGSNLICADIGNPHLIILDQNLSHKNMENIVDFISKSQIFREGININFVKFYNNEIILKVWERGIGYSYACGSGACATFAYMIRLDLLQCDGTIKFPFGSLSMKLLGDEVIMSGPVSLVARGVIDE